MKPITYAIRIIVDGEKTLEAFVESTPEQTFVKYRLDGKLKTRLRYDELREALEDIVENMTSRLLLPEPPGAEEE